MNMYYSLGSFFLSSCINHIAKLSSAKDDDWWADASDTGTWQSSVEIPSPTCNDNRSPLDGFTTLLSKNTLTWTKAIPVTQWRARRALDVRATPLANAHVPTMNAKVVVPYNEMQKL